MKTTNLLIQSGGVINWKSCKAISANLKRAYNSEDVVYFNSISRSSLQKLAESILERKPERLIFIDHLPHPGELIKEIYRVYVSQNAKLPELVIHLYGDFTMSFVQWENCESILKQFHVRFIAASEKQKKMVQKFMNHPSIDYIPFPVDTSVFSFHESKRASLRQEFGIKDGEHVFLYTGRLSRQKSILELVNIFGSWLEIMNPDACLYLAGEFDDFGIPYLGKLDGMNQYFSEYKEVLNSFPPEIKKKIIFVGNLKADKLNDLYTAADSFISLSLHHDEDFGMSPAEAGCTGLPMILTNWGGYSSFHAELVPASFENPGVSFQKEDVLKLMFKHISMKPSSRTNLAQVNTAVFSISAVGRKLQSILREKPARFEGFTPLLHELARLEREGNQTVFKTNNQTNDYYRQVYGAYL